MNFKQFKITHFLYINLLRLFLISLVILWVRDSYNYFNSSNIYNYIRDLHSISKNYDIWQPIVIIWAKNAVWFILKFIIISLLIYFGKIFPIFPKWLNYWDNNGEISPIFGKKIASHFRFNKSLSFEEIIFLDKVAYSEENLLKFHANNSEKEKFMLKYDANFKIDLNNKDIK